VAGIDTEGFIKGEKLGTHLLDKTAVVPSGKIGPPDGTGKEGVAREYRSGRKITDAAGGMPWCVEDLYPVGAKQDVLPFIDLPVGRESKTCSVQGVDIHRCARYLFQLSSAANMVNVAMRDEDVPDV
jgi:hypothetical protein